MGIRIFKEPDVKEPVLLACWPGIGNIGLVAVDTLRKELGAEEFGDIEPWDFFYPNKLIIKKDELVDIEFPTNKFYYKNLFCSNKKYKYCQFDCVKLESARVCRQINY